MRGHMNKTTSDSPCRHNRAICAPFCSQDYNEIVHDPAKFRESLDAKIEQFPELFPAEIETGYQMKDSRQSKKLSIPIRRITISGVN